MRFGLPAGISLCGMAALLWPGTSPALICCGWIVAYLLLSMAFISRRWSCGAGAWLLWAVSLVLWTGICINIDYYVNTVGNGDAAAPVLMNFDAWSAWNNALFDVGRTDALPCRWPARDYGHLVGVLIWLFGVDISIPLMFNALCALLTIVFSGSIAVSCIGGDLSEQRRTALTTMLFTSLMCYFIASGTVLIKDCPLALASALIVWAALRLRRKVSAVAVMAIAVAALATFFMRKNYLLLYAAVILALTDWRNRKRAIAGAGIAAVLLGVWGWLQYSGSAISISAYYGALTSGTSGDSSEYGHSAAYSDGLAAYFRTPIWKRLLMLPMLTAVQFLIPLPWNWDKYLIFGPFMALAHFSFFRYAVGGLILYFVGNRLRTAPRMLIAVTALGLFFYVASAFSFGGTISRYGIPLVSMLTPAAAYTWLHCRRRRSFRIWSAVFVAGIALALALSYHFTT